MDHGRNEQSIEKEYRDANEKKLIQKIINLLEDYFSGQKIELFDAISEADIDLNLKAKFSTDFSLKVINYLINNVKYGETISYSEIGKNIGSRAYRAVGNVMRRNPLPLIIPCHRVIKNNGSLGGFGGYNGDEWQHELKSKLLRIEGSRS